VVNQVNAFGDASYRTIKNILEKGLDQQLALAVPMATAGAFLRGPQDSPFHLSRGDISWVTFITRQAN